MGKLIVKRVAREKAVGWLIIKENTGRPASASSLESVSSGERKEEKLKKNKSIFQIFGSYKCPHLKMSLSLAKSFGGEAPISLSGQ